MIFPEFKEKLLSWESLAHVGKGTGHYCNFCPNQKFINVISWIWRKQVLQGVNWLQILVTQYSVVIDRNIGWVSFIFHHKKRIRRETTMNSPLCKGPGKLKWKRIYHHLTTTMMNSDKQQWFLRESWAVWEARATSTAAARRREFIA